MKSKHGLFVSYAHKEGFGNIMFSRFDEFNTEVRAALENKSISSYEILKITDIIKKKGEIKDVIILNFIWTD